MTEPITPAILHLATTAMAGLRAAAQPAPMAVSIINSDELHKELQTRNMALSPQAEKDSEALQNNKNNRSVSVIWDQETKEVLALVAQSAHDCVAGIFAYKGAPSFQLENKGIIIRRGMEKAISIPFIQKANIGLQDSHMINMVSKSATANIDLSPCQGAQIFAVTIDANSTARISYGRKTQNATLRVDSEKIVDVQMPADMAVSAKYALPVSPLYETVNFNGNNSVDLFNNVKGKVRVRAMNEGGGASPVELMDQQAAGIDKTGIIRLRKNAQSLLDAAYQKATRGR